jgi:hypothetical protein
VCRQFNDSCIPKNTRTVSGHITLSLRILSREEKSWHFRSRACFVVLSNPPVFMENDQSVRDADVWEKIKTDTFWGDVARDGHVLQVYNEHTSLIRTLFSFADEGFRAGDSVVVIATPEHQHELDRMLRDANYNLFSLRLSDQYIPINASNALSEFMIYDALDPLLFKIKNFELMKRARRSARRVRVFGEMVSLLCSRGNHKDARVLEGLWNELRREQAFTLFFGYHTSDILSNPEKGDDVCRGHSHRLSGEQPLTGETLYRSARIVKPSSVKNQIEQSAVGSLRSPAAG